MRQKPGTRRSHGEKVVKEYTTLDGAISVDTVVTLGTPQRRTSAGTPPEFVVEQNAAIIGRHFHAFSYNDVVALRGGGDGLTMNFLNWKNSGREETTLGVKNIDATSTMPWIDQGFYNANVPLTQGNTHPSLSTAPVWRNFIDPLLRR